jgi:hypothetical protein
MSSSARWSYTSKATVWPLVSRDDWGGAPTFGPPSAFACDYSTESKRMVDGTGVEFVSSLSIFTERAGIKQGDRVALGVSAALDPVAAGAVEVRAVTRWADTFNPGGL